MASQRKGNDGSGADDLSEKNSSSSNGGNTNDIRTTPMDVGVDVGVDVVDAQAYNISEVEKAKASPTGDNTSYEQGTSQHKYIDNKNNSDVELAIAKAVPCDDDGGDELPNGIKKLDIKQVAVATPAPNDDQNTLFCRRYAIVIGGCCVFGIALIILLIVLLSSSKAECDDGASLCQTIGPQLSVTSAPTASPTDQTRKTIVINYLETELSAKVFFGGSPYSMARDWILHDDPRQLDVDMDRDSKLLMQRYALAVFYFLSIQNGQNGSTPWRSCNPPSLSLNNSETENDDTCTYLVPTRSPDGSSLIYNEIPGRIRWLSSSHECEWQGINCTATKEVLQVDVRGQGIRGDLGRLLAGGAGPEEEKENTVSNVLVWGIPKLQLLYLSQNDLTGTIPASLSRFSDLTLLELLGNSLSGEIPTSFFDKLTSLQFLNLGENRLSGNLDTKIGQLTKLVGLHLYKNNFQGQLPSEIGALSSFLEYSRIWGNEFSGPLPTEIGQLTRLKEFQYSYNQFTGTIPTQFGQLTSMDVFTLNGNQLSGTIPVELCNMTNSRVIMLDGNALDGSLPTTELSQLQRLIQFKVNNNQLTGPIPSQLGDLPDLRLAWLHLNEFTGTMPDEVCEAASVPNFGLNYLQADCAPIDNPPNECRCCSACCDRSTGVCLTVP